MKDIGQATGSRFAFLLLCFFSASLLVFSLPGCGSEGSKTQKTEPAAEKKQSPVKLLVDRLVADGWDEKAAKSVAELNHDWFRTLREVNPRKLERSYRQLQRLGRFPELSDLLIEHPETAGLLASAIDVDLLARSLRDTVHVNEVESLYVMHPAPEDAALLAAALERHENLIVRLYKSGLVGVENLFIFSRGPTGGDVYDAWLDDAFSPHLSGKDPERLSSLVTLILCHGPAIRGKLASDSNFRRRFRKDLWPQFRKAVSKQRAYYAPYLWDARIWDFLLLPDAFPLLRQYGPLAIDLFVGKDAYRGRLRELVSQILLQDPPAYEVKALDKFRDTSSFRSLLERNLDPYCRQKAFLKLLSEEENSPSFLRDWATLSDTALCEEVGAVKPPEVVTWFPLYYTYYVGKKLTQGRTPGGSELFWAILDPATLFLGPLSAGTVTRIGGKVVVREVGKETLELSFASLRRRTIAQISKNFPKYAGRITSHLRPKKMAPELFSNGLNKMRRTAVRSLAEKHAFEITRPVKFLFKSTRVGRANFKRLTDLEARVFMRGDARVFILPGPAAKAAGLTYIHETGANMALDAVSKTKTGRRVLNKMNCSIREWKKHVSAWWLFVAGE